MGQEGVFKPEGEGVGVTEGVGVGVMEGVGVGELPVKWITASEAEASALVSTPSTVARFLFILLTKVRVQSSFFGPVVIVATVPVPVLPSAVGWMP